MVFIVLYKKHKTHIIEEAHHEKKKSIKTEIVLKVRQKIKFQQILHKIYNIIMLNVFDQLNRHTETVNNLSLSI